MSLRIKKDDQVVVIAGRDKGARGRVLKVLAETDQVIVEGVNKVKKHQKPNVRPGVAGGIIEKEVPIHVSKVQLLDTKTDKPTRLRTGKDKDGHKVRISARSGAVLEG